MKVKKYDTPVKQKEYEKFVKKKIKKFAKIRKMLEENPGKCRTLRKYLKELKKLL